MKNPCNNCGNFKQNTLYDTSQCRWCWLNFHTTIYNNNTTSSKAVPLIILPCVHQGDVVYRAKCMCPRKDTYKCEVGLGDNGLCTPVIHCGQSCSKYEADV